VFNFLISETDRINQIINDGAKTALSDKAFIEAEIKSWKKSPKRKAMIAGERYYNNEHDILHRKRTVIGVDGKLQEVDNIPNNMVIDNQYAKMVDQKANYLLGKPIVFKTENKEYGKLLKKIFNKRFKRTLKNLGEDSLNGGIAWLYPYYDELGQFAFKRFQPFEILPFWKDAEHTILDFAVRVYEVEVYEGAVEKIIEKVEVYRITGIGRYVLQNGSLIPDTENPSSNYVMIEGQEYNWGKIPLIPLKYNNKEIPLISRVKSLQDGINTILSDFENNMQEDGRNTILVIENLDGTNLGEFRQNLATYGAVKVRTVDGQKGGVSTLTVEVNADNYKAILELFKKALIENARGYDAKDDRMSGNPNQMNIQSMYSDIDLDANGMETEYQASFEELLWFVNMHLFNASLGDFENEEVEVIFNRDILINETEVIENCSKSVGILSDESVVSNHPWVDDPQKELERKAEQEQKAMDEYANAFPPNNQNQNLNGQGGVADG
jgi:SPP1 family phage portal protein